MSKHTPGPWSYDADENEIHSDSMQETGGDPAHICEVLGPNKEVNASLIAAAPEMLEALKTLQANFATGKTRDAIAALIAKAEGRNE